MQLEKHVVPPAVSRLDANLQPCPPGHQLARALDWNCTCNPHCCDEEERAAVTHAPLSTLAIPFQQRASACLPALSSFVFGLLVFACPGSVCCMLGMAPLLLLLLLLLLRVAEVVVRSNHLRNTTLRSRHFEINCKTLHVCVCVCVCTMTQSRELSASSSSSSSSFSSLSVVLVVPVLLAMLIVVVFSGVEARGPVRTLPGADFVRLGEAEEHL